MKLALKKLEGDGATVWWKFHNPNFNRFWLIHPCERQTDGHTDGRQHIRAIAYMLSRAARNKTEMKQNCRRSAVSFQPTVDSFVLFRFHHVRSCER